MGSRMGFSHSLQYTISSFSLPGRTSHRFSVSPTSLFAFSSLRGRQKNLNVIQVFLYPLLVLDEFYDVLEDLGVGYGKIR